MAKGTYLARFLGVNSDEAATATTRTGARGVATGGAVLATGAGAAGALWLGGWGLQSFGSQAGEGLHDFSRNVAESVKHLAVPALIVVGGVLVVMAIAPRVKPKGAARHG